MLSRIVSVYHDGKQKHGEYTGWSKVTKKHHVSFYDGSVGKFDTLTGFNWLKETSGS